MNHARWSIDLINRKKHRGPETTQTTRDRTNSKPQPMQKPKSITELVLEDAMVKRKLPVTSTASKEMMVLNADEA